jgi:hypothetical protein
MKICAFRHCVLVYMAHESFTLHYTSINLAFVPALIAFEKVGLV